MGILIVLNQIGQGRIIHWTFNVHGVMLGIYCLQGMALSGVRMVFFTIGTTMSAATIFYLIHFLIHRITHPIAVIVIRVVGSWIVAIAAMIFTINLIGAG